MNLPNKITLWRIFLSILIIIIMLFPFYEMGIQETKYLVMGKVTISLKYIICGILFIIASVTDFLDGNLARKNNQVTDFGKVMDAIADNILEDDNLNDVIGYKVIHCKGGYNNDI